MYIRTSLPPLRADLNNKRTTSSEGGKSMFSLKNLIIMILTFKPHHGFYGNHFDFKLKN